MTKYYYYYIIIKMQNQSYCNEAEKDQQPQHHQQQHTHIDERILTMVKWNLILVWKAAAFDVKNAPN